MAFFKTAKASVVRPFVTQDNWTQVREASVTPFSFETKKATQVVLGQYDPDKYLLSHCTIVASVDTEKSNLPTGIQMVDGVQVNRVYPDFLVSVGSTKYINNNNDAFERKLLLSSFRTFIGGQNYTEHVQIPELSKGRIIDAAARDIGDSIYVDILVATERKHQALIEAITSQQLGTLSMGCQVSHTVCTKCGNVSEDETQLCRHIKYEKGNFFVDATGQRRKVAELCGHILAEPGSVKFIEASWVANPAFKGAVLRNILSPTEQAAVGHRVEAALQMPVEVGDQNALRKAASYCDVLPGDHLVYLYDNGTTIGSLKAPAPNSAVKIAEKNRRQRLGFDDGMGDSEESKKKEEDSESDLQKRVDELYDALVSGVEDKVRKDLSEMRSDKTRKLIDENTNESLIKSALQYHVWRDRAKRVSASVKPPHAVPVLAGMVLFSRGGWEAVRKARRFTGTEILVMDRLIGRDMKRASMAGESRVYQAVVAVGGTAKYPNVNAYLTACSKAMGRIPTESERSLLVEKGKLFSMGL